MLNDYLDSLRNVDVVGLYLENPLLFDFLIYLFLFIGLSHLGLKKFFGDRSSRIIALILGLMLATGMIVFEEERGFNLGSFGYFAFFIIVIAIFIMVYNFFSMAFSFLPKGSSQSVKPLRFNPFLRRESEMSSESKIVRNEVISILRGEEGLNKNILGDLKRIRVDLDRYKDNPLVRNELGTIFRRLQTQRRTLISNINRLLRLNHCLEVEDWEALRNDYKFFRQIPKSTQASILKGIKSDRFRISLENRINELLKAFSEWNTRLNTLINETILFIRKKDFASAKKMVSEAIIVEQNLNSLLKRVEFLEKWIFQNLNQALSKVKKLEFTSKA